MNDGIKQCEQRATQECSPDDLDQSPKFDFTELEPIPEDDFDQ